MGWDADAYRTGRKAAISRLEQSDVAGSRPGASTLTSAQSLSSEPRSGVTQTRILVLRSHMTLGKSEGASLGLSSIICNMGCRWYLR